MGYLGIEMYKRDDTELEYLAERMNEIGVPRQHAGVE